MKKTNQINQLMAEVVFNHENNAELKSFVSDRWQSMHYISDNYEVSKKIAKQVRKALKKELKAGKELKSTYLNQKIENLKNVIATTTGINKEIHEDWLQSLMA